MRENQVLPTTTANRLVHPSVDLHFIRSLKNRATRDQHQLFLAEGSRFAIRALQRQIPIHALVYCPELFSTKTEASLARQVSQLHTPCLQLSIDTYLSMTTMKEPPGILVALPQVWMPIKSVTQGRCWIAVDEIRSSGNLGCILRTAEACGASGLICMGNETDPYDPGCVRASMSAILDQQFIRTTLADLKAWKRKTGCPFVGASPVGERECHLADMRSPRVLVLGNERHGLGEDLTSLCDLRVRIPMTEGVDSLNVSVSAGILLYEMRRQRSMAKPPKRSHFATLPRGNLAHRRLV